MPDRMLGRSFVFLYCERKFHLTEVFFVRWWKVPEAMASGNSNSDIGKKKERGNSAGVFSETRLLLSTIYPLNASETKRIQVGLQTTDNGGLFEPTIKLLGNTTTGIRVDFNTWTKLKENIPCIGSYFRRITEEIPKPILLNDITLHFTSAYGVRAIMFSRQPKTTEENISMANPANEDVEPTPAPAKKRRLYVPSIVMQKISFEGLEDIVQCIDAKYEQLQSCVNHVNDCARFLITEIELNLPKKTTVDEDIVKQTLAGKYQEIEVEAHEYQAYMARQDRRLQLTDAILILDLLANATDLEEARVLGNHARTFIIEYMAEQAEAQPQEQEAVIRSPPASPSPRSSPSYSPVYIPPPSPVFHRDHSPEPGHFFYQPEARAQEEVAILSPPASPSPTVSPSYSPVYNPPPSPVLHFHSPEYIYSPPLRTRRTQTPPQSPDSTTPSSPPSSHT